MSNMIPFEHQIILADAFAKSGLFGVKTREQALSLMALCQAEGLHPAIAVRDYHIIQGRPSLKSDALLARFQQAGGKVEWHEYTDTKVSATFSHSQGGNITVEWDTERAKKADLGMKDNWKKYPRQMLRARVLSEGIRTIYPGVCVGIYTKEEAEDFEPNKQLKKPDPLTIEAPKSEGMYEKAKGKIDHAVTLEELQVCELRLTQKEILDKLTENEYMELSKQIEDKKKIVEEK